MVLGNKSEVTKYDYERTARLTLLIFSHFSINRNNRPFSFHFISFIGFCNFFIRTKKIHTKYNESLNIHLKSHYKISNITL